MKVLNHLNIMELFEVIETWVTRCLVTEYSGIGEVFSYLLNHGCRKEKEAWGRFCQIVSSVQYCHWKSIIYMDLKTRPAFGCWPEHQDCRLWLYQWVCLWQQESGLYSPYAFWSFPRAKIWWLYEDVWDVESFSIGWSPGLCLLVDTVRDLQEWAYRILLYIPVACENLLDKFPILNSSERGKSWRTHGWTWVIKRN